MVDLIHWYRSNIAFCAFQRDVRDTASAPRSLSEINCTSATMQWPSLQSTGRTCTSSVVTLARPSVSSSLQVTNRSFTYASPYLWNQLPSSFRQPHCVHSPPGSPHPVDITSSQSPPSLSPSITSSTFHPDLKLISFTNPFLHSHSYSFCTAFMDLNVY